MAFWHESVQASQGGELINNLRAYADRLMAYLIDAEFKKLCLAADNAPTKLRSASHRALADVGPLR
jgi:hypothetical protein